MAGLRRIHNGTSAGMSDTVFNDAIHGHMDFDRILVKIINTLEFSRMRHIKQTGFCYYVFPAASHNRFEHCLGTCYLARKLLAILIQNMDPVKEAAAFPTRQEALCVYIAALCHDIGHGPFSHTWESALKKAFNMDWQHEDASVEIFKRILGREEVKAEWEREGMTDLHLAIIEGMIRGKPPKDKVYQTDKYYLFQIVSNSDNDVDVDKWDYLLRDSRQLNLIGYDPERLMRNCKVFEVTRNKLRNEICFRDKVIPYIEHMLLIRARLHELAYQHAIVKTIEAMAMDAFAIYMTEFPHPSRFHCQDITKLLQLTDAFYLEVLGSSNEKARGILERIERRDLYQIIDKVDETLITEVNKKEIELEIGRDLSNNNEDFKDDVELVRIKVDMGSKFTKKGPNCYQYTKQGVISPWQGASDTLLAPALTSAPVRGKYLVLYKRTPKLTSEKLSKCRVMIDHIIGKYSESQNAEVKLEEEIAIKRRKVHNSKV